MLATLLKDWKGEVSIDDKHYTNIGDAVSDFKTLSSDSHISLQSVLKRVTESHTACHIEDVKQSEQYKITVKRYMTEPASPGFDFMSKWNNDKPMPLRTMVGTIEKETRGMVYMKLHGQAEPVVRCMRCGRLLTNPTSQIYGIGPECMAKLGLVRIEIDDVETIKKRLVDITWEGWVIRSAITEKEEL